MTPNIPYASIIYAMTTGLMGYKYSTGIKHLHPIRNTIISSSVGLAIGLVLSRFISQKKIIAMPLAVLSTSAMGGVVAYATMWLMGQVITKDGKTPEVFKLVGLVIQLVATLVGIAAGAFTGIILCPAILLV